jgi:hypothetical protein
VLDLERPERNESENGWIEIERKEKEKKIEGKKYTNRNRSLKLLIINRSVFSSSLHHLSSSSSSSDPRIYTFNYLYLQFSSSSSFFLSTLSSFVFSFIFLHSEKSDVIIYKSMFAS